MKSGQGPSILLGGAGADELTGGSGRDILIGGTGADRLVGGGDDDVLIAGETVYDGDSRALGAILAEWIRTDTTYDRRVENILDGFGHAVGTPLDASTAFDDADRDTLTGSSGDDWYVYTPAGATPDLATGRHRTERIVETGPAPVAGSTARIDWTKSSSTSPAPSRLAAVLPALWLLDVLAEIERDALAERL